MNIIFFTPVPIPIGMASTQRILQIADILSSNHHVKIFITQVQPLGIGTSSGHKGYWKNIYFEYLTGTNRRSLNFFLRRIVQIWGSINSILRIISLKINNKIDAIYLYGEQRNFVFTDFFIVLTGNVLRVPVIRELCERTWSEKENKNLFERLISPLWGISGAICISDYLINWAKQNGLKLKKQIDLLQIPILIHKSEVKDSKISEQDSGYVLFAGAPEYQKTILFLLNAMEYVWEQYPDERLVITGFDLNTKRAAWLSEFLSISGIKYKKVEVCGFLERDVFTQYIDNANALLLPLFNDVDSEARFPNKLGEYLISGKPVVTCDVGEVGKILRNGDNALVISKAIPYEFAKKIIESKSKNNAKLIGENGRKTALRLFSSDVHAEKINIFFEVVGSGRK
jgi:glycosyltransferase involved in cell wall biosynthesis